MLSSSPILSYPFSPPLLPYSGFLLFTPPSSLSFRAIGALFLSLFLSLSLSLSLSPAIAGKAVNPHVPSPRPCVECLLRHTKTGRSLQNIRGNTPNTPVHPKTITPCALTSVTHLEHLSHGSVAPGPRFCAVIIARFSIMHDTGRPLDHRNPTGAHRASSARSVSPLVCGSDCLPASPLYACSSLPHANISTIGQRTTDQSGAVLARTVCLQAHCDCDSARVPASPPCSATHTSRPGGSHANRSGEDGERGRGRGRG